MRLGSILVGVTAAIALAGCGAGSTAGEDSGKLSVVATTTQIADFARNIGGDRITVTQILASGVDPHGFEPSPADLTAIGRAKVVLRNGVGLDEWISDSATAAGYEGELTDVSTGVTLREGGKDEHAEEAGGEEHGDPHIWQNPLNAKIMVANIEAAISAADPDGATIYRQNRATYDGKLDKLDQDIRAQIATIPPAGRKLVTNHDAFGYYIDRYQLEYVGSIIPSFDTSAELSGAELTELVNRVKATGVKAIFSESSLPPKTAETVARDAGVRVEAGEDSLYSDTLGPQGSPGATYIGALTHNTDVIVQALRD